MKRLLCASLSAALCVSGAAPALAYDHGFAEAYARKDSAAAATVGFRVPLGTTRKAEKPTYGLSLTYGQSAAPLGVAQSKPSLKLADLSFNAEGLDTAKLAGFDFAQKDQALADERLNMMGPDGKSTTAWVVTGLVVAGLAIWLISEADDDDD